MQKRSETTVRVVAMLIVVFTIALVSAFVLLSRSKRGVPRVMRKPFEYQMRERISRGMERAARLAKSGNHLAAALLFSQLAAAQDVLIPRKDRSGCHRDEPCVLEKTARQQFSLARAADVYEAMLKLKYPGWNPEADAVSPENSVRPVE